MKNKRTSLAIAILTVITALLWVLSSAFRVTQKTTITPEMSAIIKPLDPVLDQSAIDALQQINNNQK